VAKVLGKAEQVDAYARLAAEVKAAIPEEFFSVTGRLAVPTQTEYVMALSMDLVPDDFNGVLASHTSWKTNGCIQTHESMANR
jgi:hypothetical protein